MNGVNAVRKITQRGLQRTVASFYAKDWFVASIRQFLHDCDRAIAHTPKSLPQSMRVYKPDVLKRLREQYRKRKNFYMIPPSYFLRAKTWFVLVLHNSSVSRVLYDDIGQLNEPYLKAKQRYESRRRTTRNDDDMYIIDLSYSIEGSSGHVTHILVRTDFARQGHNPDTLVAYVYDSNGKPELLDRQELENEVDLLFPGADIRYRYSQRSHQRESSSRARKKAEKLYDEKRCNGKYHWMDFVDDGTCATFLLTFST